MGRKNEERIEAVRQLLARGLTNSEAGNRLGITRNAVAGIRARHLSGVEGLTKPKPRRVMAPLPPRMPPPPPAFTWTEQLDKCLRVMAFDRMTARQIGEALGCSHHEVNRRAKELDVLVAQKTVSRVARDGDWRTTPDEPLDVALNPVGHKLMDRFQDGYQGQAATRDITQLDGRCCHFPIDTDKGTRFCGQDAAPGVSYCAVHARRCFNKVVR